MAPAASFRWSLFRLLVLRRVLGLGRTAERGLPDRVQRRLDRAAHEVPLAPYLTIQNAERGRGSEPGEGERRVEPLLLVPGAEETTPRQDRLELRDQGVGAAAAQRLEIGLSLVAVALREVGTLDQAKDGMRGPVVPAERERHRRLDSHALIAVPEGRDQVGAAGRALDVAERPDGLLADANVLVVERPVQRALDALVRDPAQHVDDVPDHV